MKPAVISETILERARVRVTQTSLVIEDPDLPYDTFEELCKFVGDLNKSCAWWTGDMLLAGEGLYGEKVAQAAELLGLSPQTIMNRMSICKHVPRSRRRPELPFSAHAEVAYMEPADQKHWLEEAVRNSWSRSELRSQVRKPPSPPVEVLCVCPNCGDEHRNGKE